MHVDTRTRVTKLLCSAFLHSQSCSDPPSALPRNSLFPPHQVASERAPWANVVPVLTANNAMRNAINIHKPRWRHLLPCRDLTTNLSHRRANLKRSDETEISTHVLLVMVPFVKTQHHQTIHIRQKDNEPQQQVTLRAGCG